VFEDNLLDDCLQNLVWMRMKKESEKNLIILKIDLNQ